MFQTRDLFFESLSTNGMVIFFLSLKKEAHSLVVSDLRLEN